MEIDNISNYHVSIDQKQTQLQKKKTAKGQSFSQLLRNSLQRVNNFQQQANQASRDLALGKTDSIHQVMIANRKAETSLNLATEIQSKVVSSYKEIMRMQV